VLSKWAFFKRRCFLAGIWFKILPNRFGPSPVNPTSEWDYVGIHVNQTNKTWQLETAWASKVAPRLFKIFSWVVVPLRGWWYLCGCVFWFTRVTMTPNAELHVVRDWMSEMGTSIQSGQITWDTLVDLPSQARENPRPFVYHIQLNIPRKWIEPRHLAIIYTDACLRGPNMINEIWLAKKGLHFQPCGKNVMAICIPCMTVVKNPLT